MDSTAIGRMLPASFQRAAGPGSVLAALLAVMEGLHAPSEQRLAAAADLFSPYHAPAEFLRFLAGWVALDHITAAADEPALPSGRLRDLIAEAARIAQWRGTAQGMRTVLEVATGVPGFEVEEPRERPFHVVVRVPASACRQLALVRRIVEAEKPAAVTCEVVAGQSGRPSSKEKS